MFVWLRDWFEDKLDLYEDLEWYWILFQCLFYSALSVAFCWAGIHFYIKEYFVEILDENFVAAYIDLAIGIFGILLAFSFFFILVFLPIIGYFQIPEFIDDKLVFPLREKKIIQLKNKVKIKKLIRLLGRENYWELQEEIISSIKEIEIVHVKSVLTSLLGKSRNSDQREHIVKILGDISGEDIIPVFIGVLRNDKDIYVKKETIKVLNKFKDSTESHQQLLSLLAEEIESDIKSDLAILLVTFNTITNKVLEQLIDVLFWPNKRTPFGYSDKLLIDSFSILDEEMSEYLALKLLEIVRKDIIEPIDPYGNLKHENVLLATKLLGNLKYKPIIPDLLLELSSNESISIKQAILFAIFEIGLSEDEMVIIFSLLLNDNDLEIRSTIAIILGRTKYGKAIPELKKAIKIEDNKPLMFDFAFALAKLEGVNSEGITIIEQLIQNNELTTQQNLDYNDLCRKLLQRDKLEGITDKTKNIQKQIAGAIKENPVNNKTIEILGNVTVTLQELLLISKNQNTMIEGLNEKIEEKNNLSIKQDESSNKNKTSKDHSGRIVAAIITSTAALIGTLLLIFLK
ncbi:MAG: HEAT repeat domain-containing protein [Candidatus Heimdallarchaeota archaeon]